MPEPEVPGTSIAPVNAVTYERPMTLIDEWEDTVASIRHSFDLTDPVQWAMYMRCLGNSTAELQQSFDVDLEVNGWVLHLTKRVDEVTGEVFAGLRLALHCTDGSVIAGGSRPVIETWAHVARRFSGTTPFPVMTVRLARVKAKMGHYIQVSSITIKPVLRADAPKKTK